MKIICNNCAVQMYGTKINDEYIYKCTGCGIKVKVPTNQSLKVNLT